MGSLHRSCWRLLRLLRPGPVLNGAPPACVGSQWLISQPCQGHPATWAPSQHLQYRLEMQQLPTEGFARHYAKHKDKGKKKQQPKQQQAAAADEGEEGEAAEAADDDFDVAVFETRMQQAVEYLQHELAGVRTGRANPGLLENVPVDAHGEHVPLKAVAAVIVRNPQLLAVSVYDPSLVGAVQKAIHDLPLGLNPSSEGSELLVKLPRMTNEVVEKMIKLVHMQAEGAHQSIRRARQKGMDAVKKAFKGGSEDERKLIEKEIQKLHDMYVSEVERLKKIKDTELREHKD